MGRLRVHRLDVSSMGKFMGIVGVCCGPFLALVPVVIVLYLSETLGEVSGALVLGLVLAVISGAGVLGIWGICLGILVALVFNLLARWTGGIVIEVD
jgi:hypothetical protein